MNPLYVIVIPREEIENKDTGTIKHYIKQFEKIAAKSQCAEITISGFDNSTDEVFEIPEIRAWSTKVLQQTPEILYYTSLSMGATTRLLASVYDIETVSPKRMNAHEAAAYFAEHGAFQQQPVYITIPENELKKVCLNIRNYGIKRKDLQGANKIIRTLNELFAEKGKQ